MFNDEAKIKSIERQEGIIDLHALYRSANFFHFPQDEELKYNKKAMEDLYTKIISLHLSIPKESKKLEYGPVLA